MTLLVTLNLYIKKNLESLLMTLSTYDLVRELNLYLDSGKDIFCMHDVEGNGYSKITNVFPWRIATPYECPWNLKSAHDSETKSTMHAVLSTDEGTPLSMHELIERLNEYPGPVAIEMPTGIIKTICNVSLEQKDPEYDVPLSGSCIILCPPN